MEKGMKNLFLMFLFCFVLCVGIKAQEFGGEAKATEAAEAAPANVQPGSEVAETQDTEVPQAATAEEQLNDYLASKDNLDIGYDEEKDRIIVLQKIEFDIKNPNVSTDFLNLRTEKMSELLITAKASIIETIFSKMSGSRILNVPGNPIAKQLEKEMKEVNKALAAAQKDLETFGFNYQEAAARRDSVNASEVMATISSWFTAKDKENYAAKLDADKKEAYENAKKDFQEAAAKYEELKDKAEQVKGTVSKELKTSLSRVSAMPIYGCTVLQQADSIQKRNGKYRYQIAILYCWSGKMQEAAGQILQGNSMKFKPGKKTLKEWLNHKAKAGALSTWVGPRNFIDKNGNMWFLGIASAPTDDDADTEEANREAAELEAASEVMFALYSDAASSKTLEKLSRTVRLDATGEAQTKVYKDYSKTQQESFKDIQISGNSKVYSGTVKHQPSGLDIQVVIYAVNSGSVKALKDIQKRAVALGIEVNTAQEVERGRQEQYRKSFEASKNNPEARRAGANAAQKDLKAEADKRAAARRAANKPKNTFEENKAVEKKGGNKGQLKTGTTKIVDEDDDDF